MSNIDEVNTDELNIMVSMLAKKLNEKGLTISTAESCTGGGIGQLFTSLSGSSSWYQGGVIAYSNHLKISALNVSPAEIETYGAVSENVARSMAQGAANLANAELAVSTTGVAGPTGGTKEKPVGMVCFGWKVPGAPAFSDSMYFEGNRENVRQQSILYSIKNILERV